MGSIEAALVEVVLRRINDIRHGGSVALHRRATATRLPLCRQRPTRYGKVDLLPAAPLLPPGVPPVPPSPAVLLAVPVVLLSPPSPPSPPVPLPTPLPPSPPLPPVESCAGASAV